MQACSSCGHEVVAMALEGGRCWACRQDAKIYAKLLRYPATGRNKRAVAPKGSRKRKDRCTHPELEWMSGRAISTGLARRIPFRKKPSLEEIRRAIGLLDLPDYEDVPLALDKRGTRT